MPETFEMPAVRPATASDPKRCEADLGIRDVAICGEPVTVAVTITEPPHPASYGRTRTWGFCSGEHARHECEILWGIGVNFPKEA